MRGGGAVAIMLTGVLAGCMPSGAPNLEGTYRLVKRVLPDGSEVSPPRVVGFATYTRSHRSFQLAWDEPQGTRVSLSLIAEYELTPGRYCESVVHWVQDNLDAPGVRYQAPAAKRSCTEVRLENDRITFQVPGELHSLAFSPDGFVASAAGRFVDHWQKVD
jgi:hypothetical protein